MSAPSCCRAVRLSSRVSPMLHSRGRGWKVPAPTSPTWTLTRPVTGVWISRLHVRVASVFRSGWPPDDMHELSIAEAIAQHRPTLVVFASPAFCTSRICGPEVHVVQSLEPDYRGRLAFIHIEIYRDFKPDPSKRQLAPTVAEWRLTTEPWIFLIGPNGVIQARFEGPTATDEVKAAIDQ